MTGHGPKHREIPDPFKEWARKQVEAPELTPCCARCKTPFGHSAIAGVCCHRKGTRP